MLQRLLPEQPVPAFSFLFFFFHTVTGFDTFYISGRRNNCLFETNTRTVYLAWARIAVVIVGHIQTDYIPVWKKKKKYSCNNISLKVVPVQWDAHAGRSGAKKNYNVIWQWALPAKYMHMCTFPVYFVMWAPLFYRFTVYEIKTPEQDSPYS